MSLFDRSGILRFIWRRQKNVPRAVVRRWQAAYRADPALADDLIHLGHVLVRRAEYLEDGEIRPDPIDPVRLAYEQGQRDLALAILSLMHLTPFEMNQLMGASDVS